PPSTTAVIAAIARARRRSSQPRSRAARASPATATPSAIATPPDPEMIIPRTPATPAMPSNAVGGRQTGRGPGPDSEPARAAARPLAPRVHGKARLVVDVEKEDRQRQGQDDRGREGHRKDPPSRQSTGMVRSDGHRRPLYWPLWRACRLSGPAPLPRRASISRSVSGFSRPS